MNGCEIGKKCGGCQLQNLTYPEQLSMKQAKMIRLLGKFCHVQEIIGMEDPSRYRNKATRAFCYRRGKTVAGLYQSATDRVTEMEDCLLEQKEVADIAKTVKKLCLALGIKAYDLSTGKGFLRTVLVRHGVFSGEVMVAVVSKTDKFPQKAEFAKQLLAAHPYITTLVWNVNPTDTAVFLGQKSEVLFGDGTITDTLCGLRFRISPRSFYQINPAQAEILYQTAVNFADLTGKETVIDAYCGTGTIGLAMANRAKRVIGVESNADAVRDAAENAVQNGIKNARFLCRDAGQVLEDMAKCGEKADVVVADPPRAGCSKRFLQSLLALAPDRVVYVSCNPETLVRDLYTLCKGGYKVRKLQPVDMFPHTEHVECVALVTKTNKDFCANA